MSRTVSVCLMAYNHEKYICQALDSVLEQQTEHSYEILVFEDGSNDSTLEKIQQYQAKHPQLIKVFSSPKNIGHFLNLRTKFKEAQGKYVCILDGDDYWCSKHKLQIQVDFLEKNPSFVGVAHNVLLDSGGRKKTMSPKRKEGIYDIYDIVSGRVYFHTSSLLHQNIFREKLPEVYFSPHAGDWFLSMLYAEKGPIYYFTDVMSVYRFHGGGLWSGMRGAERRKANIEAALEYDKLLDYKYSIGMS
jgi:glycosyltransferase involved in cell wall biosynthesis